VDKLLLTPEEAASVLSIGRSKVYELMSDGRLTSVRIDASRRVPMSALVEFVERLREQREPSGVALGRLDAEPRWVAGGADKTKEPH
jgi:excisionase family DNA binding protein